MNKLLLCILTVGCIFMTHASSLEAIENSPIDLHAIESDRLPMILETTEQLNFSLGDDIVTCEGESITLQLTPMPENVTLIQWQFFDELTGTFIDIVGETNPTLDVNQTGEYQILIDFEDGSVFSDTISVHFNELPPVNVPVPFEVCDDIESGSDVDEFATFDLPDRIFEIIGPNPNVSVSFHLTASDADAGTPTLPDMYQNVVSSSQTIWVRVTHNITGCYNLTTLTLIVNALPSPSSIPDVMVCDDNDDGIGFFDLQVLGDDILNGETNAALSFHETLEDAELGASEIDLTLPYASITNPQTLYVRATDIDPLTTTECFRIITITLVTNPSPPIATPIPDLTQCNDGSDLVLFDLETNTVIILGGLDPTNYTVTYHETQMAAADGFSSIGDPANYLVSAPGTVIWARLENSITGCASIASFNLSIVESPILSQNTPFNYTFCEEFDGDDSQGEIDLMTLADDAGFLVTPQNIADFNISYHNTASEADNNAFPIDQSVLFIVSDGDQIFFRIENLDTGCTSISSVIFNVESRPLTTTPADYEACDDDNDGIFDSFVLSSRNDEITGGAPDVEVTYFFTEEGAINAPIGQELDDVNYTNINDPFFQTLYARIENETTGCFAIEPLNLVVLNTPEINNIPSAYSVCDNDSDGIGIFDLTSRESEILDGLNPANFSIVWYVNQAAVDANVPIVNPESYISNASTVIAVVTDINQSTTTFCSQQVELELNLNACIDTDNDGVPDEEEDLNGNGDLEDDDTDNDDIPNYLDDDDDGDLVMTIDEITGIGAGVTPQDFIDTDDDMIENYLDDDDDGDLVLTRDEDYNNSGSPLDDDINDNGIPDFLDPDVALSTDEFTVTNFTLYPNPAIDHITITGTVPFEKISIYDITGKLLLEQVEVSQVTQTLTLPAIKKGMYFIRIDNQSSAFRFIKK